MVPPAGIEPTHMASEANALSTELRGQIKIFKKLDTKKEPLTKQFKNHPLKQIHNSFNCRAFKSEDELAKYLIFIFYLAKLGPFFV